MIPFNLIFFSSGLLIQVVCYTKCSSEYEYKETTSFQEMVPIFTAMMHLQCLAVTVYCEATKVCMTRIFYLKCVRTTINMQSPQSSTTQNNQTTVKGLTTTHQYDL